MISQCKKVALTALAQVAPVTRLWQDKRVCHTDRVIAGLNIQTYRYTSDIKAHAHFQCGHFIKYALIYFQNFILPHMFDNNNNNFSFYFSNVS